MSALPCVVLFWAARCAALPAVGASAFQVWQPAIVYTCACLPAADAGRVWAAAIPHPRLPGPLRAGKKESKAVFKCCCRAAACPCPHPHPCQQLLCNSFVCLCPAQPPFHPAAAARPGSGAARRRSPAHAAPAAGAASFGRRARSCGGPRQRCRGEQQQPLRSHLPRSPGAGGCQCHTLYAMLPLLRLRAACDASLASACETLLTICLVPCCPSLLSPAPSSHAFLRFPPLRFLFQQGMDPAEAGIVEQAMGLAGHARGGAGADAAAYARYGGGYAGRYADPRDAVAGGERAAPVVLCPTASCARRLLLPGLCCFP